MTTIREEMQEEFKEVHKKLDMIVEIKIKQENIKEDIYGDGKAKRGIIEKTDFNSKRVYSLEKWRIYTTAFGIGALAIISVIFTLLNNSILKIGF